MRWPLSSGGSERICRIRRRLRFHDGRRCVIDWKTAGARYPEEPEGLLALDPQLVCYSWLTGEPEVAFVVFVRKRFPEIQYLRATISSKQWREFQLLVHDMPVQVELGQFPAHPGIRFPQNTCTTCSYVASAPTTGASVSECWCMVQEASLPGLMSSNIKEWPMPPKLDPERAQFVLTKIDQILEWETQVERERDTRFVELGKYLCEVRAGQYWRLQNLKSLDEYLARKFPESRRKAYYLMSIHEQLPKHARKQLKQVGWSKAAELAKVARKGWGAL